MRFSPSFFAFHSVDFALCSPLCVIILLAFCLSSLNPSYHCGVAKIIYLFNTLFVYAGAKYLKIMDNPACSTVDVPPLHKTDHSSTSLFDDSELELQCYHNEGVIVDDEERNEDKTEHDDDISMSKAEYSAAVMNIIQSSPSWKNKDSTEINSNSESDDIDREDGSDTLKTDDNYRGSDGESSNISLCSTYSEPYIKVRTRIFFVISPGIT